MNNKQKEVLQHHRNFLLRNVVWTDDLANKMLAEGIITDLTMKEIQSKITVEIDIPLQDGVGDASWQIGRIFEEYKLPYLQKKPGEASSHGKHHDRKKLLVVLDSLPLRGEAVFTKFCDLLHVNGHPFIADLLRDDEAGISSEITGLKDIYKRIPSLEKVLKDSDRRTLEMFIIEKVKETSLKASWSKDAVAREKHKAIKAMEKQLEDAFQYEIKEREKNEEIAKLKEELEEEKQRVTELKSELNFIKSELQTTESKMRNDFGVQMKFSLANENALRKQTEKYEKCTKVLTTVDNRIKSILQMPPRTSERDQMALVEFPFAFLVSDLEAFISKYNILLDIEKQYETLLHERNYILAHLGVKESDDSKPSLLTAYRDFAVKTDEDLTELKQKLTLNSDVIEGQRNKIDDLSKEVEKQSQASKLKTAGTAWQNALLNVMRKQLNDVKHENRKKDTKLRVFESEISKLKARISELEAQKQLQLVHAPVQSHTPRDLLNIEALKSRSSSYPNEEYDSSIVSVAEANKKRNMLLPPLGGKVHYQNVEMISQHDQSLKRPKQRHQGRQVWDHKQNVMNPESLITAQLKLESKGMPVPAPLGGKYGHMMPHKLGDFKNMHGKPGIYK